MLFKPANRKLLLKTNTERIDMYRQVNIPPQFSLYLKT